MDECPKFLAKNPSVKNHSVYFRQHDLRLPLQIYGIVSYLPARAPLENELLPISLEIELAPNAPDWDPHDQMYQEQEESMLTYKGEIKDSPKRRFIISSVVSRVLDPVALCADVKEKCTQQVYSIKTASGATSTIKPQDLSAL